MRCLLRSWLAVTALAVLAGPCPAAGDADAILSRAIAAHGGEEALARYKAVRLKLKVILAGNDATPKEWQLLFAAPDRLREVREGYYLGRRKDSVGLVNGKGAWSVRDGRAEPMSDKLAEAYRDEAYLLQVTRLVPLKGKEYTLTAAGDADVDGKPAVGLLVRSKGRRDVTLFFDKDSALLVKVERKVIATSTLEEAAEERFYQDYQKDVPPVARKVLVVLDGKTDLQIEVKEAKFLEKADEAAFRR